MLRNYFLASCMVLFRLFSFAQNEAVSITDPGPQGRNSSFNFIAGATINLSCGTNPVFEIEFDSDFDVSNVAIIKREVGDIKLPILWSGNIATVTFENVPSTATRIDFDVKSTYVKVTTCGGDKPIKVTLKKGGVDCNAFSSTRNVSVARSSIAIYPAYNENVNYLDPTVAHPFYHTFQISSNYYDLSNSTIEVDLGNVPLKLLMATEIRKYYNGWNSLNSYNSKLLSAENIVGTTKYRITGLSPNSTRYIMLYFDVLQASVDPNASYKFQISASIPDCATNSRSIYTPEFTLFNQDDAVFSEAPNLQNSIASSFNITNNPCSPTFIPSRDVVFSQQVNNIYTANAFSSLTYELEIDKNYTINSLNFFSFGTCPDCLIKKIETNDGTIDMPIYSPVTPVNISDIPSSITVGQDAKRIKITFEKLSASSSLVLQYNCSVKSSLTSGFTGIFKSLLKKSDGSILFSRDAVQEVKITLSTFIPPENNSYSFDYGMGTNGTSWITSALQVTPGNTYSFKAFLYYEGSFSDYKFVYDINPNLNVIKNSLKVAIGQNSPYLDKGGFQEITDFKNAHSEVLNTDPVFSNNNRTITINGLNLIANTCQLRSNYLTIYYEAIVDPKTPAEIQYNACGGGYNCTYTNGRSNSTHYTYPTSWIVPEGDPDFTVTSTADCGSAVYSKLVSVAPSKPYKINVTFNNKGNGTARNPVFLVYLPIIGNRGSTANSDCINFPSNAELTGTIIGSLNGTSAIYTVEYSTDNNPCLFSRTDGTVSPDLCNSNDATWTTSCPSSFTNLAIRLTPKSNTSLSGFSKLSIDIPYTLSGTASQNTLLKFYALGSASYKLYNQYVGKKEDETATTVKVDPNSVCKIEPPIACKECIQSFSPIPNSKYTITAWVKEKVLQPSAVSGYTGPVIGVEFESGSVSMSPCSVSGSSTTPNTFEFSAEGAVIEGWQRLEGTFVVPCNATAVKLKLKNNGTQEVFFDDVRVHPFNSRMKSFVYDPVTQKLTAELDEENYATFYEYDDEGSLIRVKKETERGVMTIKETRMNQAK